MANESVIDGRPAPWYSKVFMCLIHRNRISPEKVEMPDCDFLIIEPRRTLRILRPIQNSDEFYEVFGDRPESINENFITRWTKRSHSLNKCRCSFRQSSSKISPEQEMISAEINRIRTSLCEAEKTALNIDELEKRISVNLGCFNDALVIDEKNHLCEKSTNVNSTNVITGNFNDDADLITKNKTVKDLEKYIDVLLKEVLNDTMKFISDADNTLDKSRKTLHQRTSKNLDDTDDESLKSHLNINFAFLPNDQTINDGMESQTRIMNASDRNGYINSAFIGSTHDPDCLDFELRKPIDNDKHLDKVDCVDSGVNSVETMEFPLDPELSLEQSLMKIIDAKFGRVPLSYSWENLNTPNTIVDKDYGDLDKNNVIDIQAKKYDDVNSIISLIKDDIKCEDNINKDVNDSETPDISQLDMPIIENKFDELRLELNIDSKTPTLGDETVNKINSVTVLCGKLTAKLSKKGNTGKNNRDDRKKREKNDLEYKKKRTLEGVEMQDYRATWKGCNKPNSNSCENELTSPKDSLVVWRNRKPFIVFLHGFGSSGEVFEHQLQYFSAMGYPCIAPEMLGHGMSSAPDRLRDYHFDKLLNDIETVLHHYAFKSGRKCVLVAHNYGCSFATALACKYENEIRQLVLISGGGPTPLAPPTTEGACQCCLRLILSPFLVCGLRRDLLYSARGRQHPYCGPELDNQWPSHMKYILNGMIWPEGDYIFHRRISTPTLLIHGLRDNKVSLVQECQMERTILKAFLEAIPTAGHIPMTDAPEQVNHMIHCFIDLWKQKKW